jgi:opacity protein-like surface antigen
LLFIFYEEALMKKVLIVVVAVASLVIASAAFAGQATSNTGCGLGTMLFRNNADNSILLQAFQATTNGIFGNQTFGITTGTSDCQQPKNFVSNERVNEFMLANMDNLAKDIAQGRGEILETFAELMGVPAEKRPEFYASLQSGFTRIYTSHEVQMASVMDNISTVSK